MDTPVQRLLGGLAAGVAAALALTSPASAWVPLHLYDVDGKELCKSIRFTSGQVKVILHTAEYTGTGKQDVNALKQAVKDVNRQMALVGGSSVEITSTATSTAPFTYGTPYGDTVPTIHVGFVSSLDGDGDGDDDALGQTWPVTPSTSRCDYNEVQIAFLDQAAFPWDVTTPFDAGGPYYQTGRYNSSNVTWFRPSYQHELIHAFGLHHTHGSYAFMNYGARPWANRAKGDAIRPLPDDAHGLRDMYPALTTRNEVALLNTWNDSTDTSKGAAEQKVLCQPSDGLLFTSPFSAYCGITSSGYGRPTIGGSAVICAGKTVDIQVALANYSTADVQTELHLWFSHGDVNWGDPDDIESADSYAQVVGKNNSTLLAHSFTLPTTLTATTVYNPIAQVDSWFDLDGDGVHDAGTHTYDWIPLRGAITTC